MHRTALKASTVTHHRDTASRTAGRIGGPTAHMRFPGPPSGSPASCPPARWGGGLQPAGSRAAGVPALRCACSSGCVRLWRAGGSRARPEDSRRWRHPKYLGCGDISRVYTASVAAGGSHTQPAPPAHQVHTRQNARAVSRRLRERVGGGGRGAAPPGVWQKWQPSGMHLPIDMPPGGSATTHQQRQAGLRQRAAVPWPVLWGLPLYEPGRLGRVCPI